MALVAYTSKTLGKRSSKEGVRIKIDDTDRGIISISKEYARQSNSLIPCMIGRQ